ncbi:DUF4150 domain-containing protein [Gynuella sunshinyii]|uniref:Uncharacterized protein n=1 Tax=Gynuella sunshinyii YC6258 TaxID=1445510 RepID=A0A0C5VW13_9GAMM|nr:DUF4150 domain-containing protein [Gynuella sunshinyii]AJQ97518.1 hypothetical Protein YC6258_05490 [Gynuella sunshinyii YC6258]
MFATTQLIAMSFAFPDVCKVIVGVAVIMLPFPNLAMASVHIPNVYNHYIGGGMVHNLLTFGTISNGDEAGVAMGIVSNVIIGPDQYLLGSFKVFHGVSPASRQTSMTTNNSYNMVGMVLVPSINTVILLG